jgi:hypothetical protein
VRAGERGGPRDVERHEVAVHEPDEPEQLGRKPRPPACRMRFAIRETESRPACVARFRAAGRRPARCGA